MSVTASSSSLNDTNGTSVEEGLPVGGDTVGVEKKYLRRRLVAIEEGKKECGVWQHAHTAEAAVVVVLLVRGKEETIRGLRIHRQHGQNSEKDGSSMF